MAGQNPFLRTLQNMGLYNPNAPQEPQGFDGIPLEIVQAARAQSLTGVGSQLLAAGMAGTPAGRAQALAGISDAADMSRPLYNMAQARLMATPKPKELDQVIEQIGDRMMLVNRQTGEMKDLGAAPAGSGSNGINITNMMPGDKKFDEEQAKLAAAREGTLMDEANAASAKLGKLNAIQAVNGMMQGGTFAEYKGQAVAMLKSLGANEQFIGEFTGLDPRLPEQQQIMQKMVAELVVGSIGPGGFPAQNFSNADREFLEKMFPQINGQPWANDLVIEALKRTEEFKIRRAEDWDNYAAEAEASGQTPSYRLWERGFRQRILEEEKAGKTLFGDIKTEIEKRYSTQGGVGGGSPASPGAVTPDRRQQILDMYLPRQGGAGR